MSYLDWGSVPAWVATVITSISAAVALTTYLRSQYDKRNQSRPLLIRGVPVLASGL
jgi:anti-sigma-K factor RskA